MTFVLSQTFPFLRIFDVWICLTLIMFLDVAHAIIGGKFYLIVKDVFAGIIIEEVARKP